MGEGEVVGGFGAEVNLGVVGSLKSREGGVVETGLLFEDNNAYRWCPCCSLTKIVPGAKILPPT